MGSGSTVAGMGKTLLPVGASCLQQLSLGSTGPPFQTKVQAHGTYPNSQHLNRAALLWSTVSSKIHLQNTRTKAETKPIPKDYLNNTFSNEVSVHINSFFACQFFPSSPRHPEPRRASVENMSWSVHAVFQMFLHDCIFPVLGRRFQWSFPEP